MTDTPKPNGPIRVAVIGAAGRTGSRIIALADQDDRFIVDAALEVAGHDRVGERVVGIAIDDALPANADVLIDFSRPQGTVDWAKWAVSARVPMVIGTTGHDDAQLTAIRQAAEKVAVLKATNMSVGVNVLWRLAREAASLLGDAFDIEIVEAHHRYKVDAPSGTAITLLESVCEGAGLDPAQAAVYGRQGETGARPAGQVGVHALRIGDTVGRHEAHFGGLGETLTLTHTAQTRDIFARGALRAAQWIVTRPPGLYSMQDVLFG